MRALVFSLLLAASAAAQPVITSIAPNAGTVAGGTVVTIKGSGFSDTPQVTFSGTPAQSVTRLDASTLRATTPPLLPGTYSVAVLLPQVGGWTLSNAYTVTGDAAGEFESILLPVYSPPVRGAFGSEFHTIASGANTSVDPNLLVYGGDPNCGIIVLPPPFDPLTPFVLEPGQPAWFLNPQCAAGPGKILYVRKDRANEATFNVRVADVTRTDSTLGTEIPVIRSREMTTGPITLLNVPADARYRNTLRIYALRPTVVFVTTVGPPIAVQLQPGSNIFEPAYAQVSGFPSVGSPARIRVTIAQPQDVVAGPPMWAFITVTNNETQQITTITPDLQETQ